MKLNIPQVYLIDISNKNFECQCPLSRAFLHTLQGVQNNTPFRLLHSLHLHTLEGVQNYTPLFSLVSDHRSNWNKNK
jgi:hypothetical protein